MAKWLMIHLQFFSRSTPAFNFLESANLLNRLSDLITDLWLFLQETSHQNLRNLFVAFLRGFHFPDGLFCKINPL